MYLSILTGELRIIDRFTENEANHSRLKHMMENSGGGKGEWKTDKDYLILLTMEKITSKAEVRKQGWWSQKTNKQMEKQGNY